MGTDPERSCLSPLKEFLELFAEQAAIAILNARRHEQALREMRTLELERAALHAAVAEQRARETALAASGYRSALIRDSCPRAAPLPLFYEVPIMHIMLS